jgi:hypothetical protein
MTVIGKHLGHRVTLPDNLRYYVKQGLWARLAGSAVTCGFSEPALALSGRIQDLDFLNGKGWLFSVTPADAASQAYQALSDCAANLESLQGSEGFKNPEGLKGGVSGVCKAVYSGIRMQKIHS